MRKRSTYNYKDSDDDGDDEVSIYDDSDEEYQPTRKELYENNDEDLEDENYDEDLEDANDNEDPEDEEQNADEDTVDSGGQYFDKNQNEDLGKNGNCEESLDEVQKHVKDHNECMGIESRRKKHNLKVEGRLEDNKHVDVTVQQMADDSGKKIPKTHVCLFCKEAYSKIPRHMEQVHAQEPDVAKILCMKKKSSERREAWEKLEKMGDYLHNCDVKEERQGTLLPKYRSRAAQKQELYFSCYICHASYPQSSLWRHEKRCAKKAGKDNKRVRRHAISNAKMMWPSTESQLYGNILKNRRDDDIKHIAEDDPLIIEFGCRMGKKGRGDEQTPDYISTKVRELARVVQAGRNISKNVSKLEDLLLPCNWDVLIKSVQSAAKFKPETNEYGTPSLALKAGYSLQKCAKYRKLRAMREGDGNMEKKMLAFQEMYEGDWDHQIAYNARQTLDEAKFNKPQRLPIVQDVACLSKYLDERVLDTQSQMSQVENIQTAYTELAQLTLTQLILFNRKRSGETQRLKVSDFAKAKDTDSFPEDEEVLASLSRFEKVMARSHFRMETRGKRRRKVAVLITEPIKESIQIIISNRSKAGIPDENNFIFARPCGNRPYRGSDCLSKFAKDSGVKMPELMTSTRLRKQLGTLCQILHLKENHQDIVASFMGHDIRTHREFYRLPENLLETAKVAKVLHAINTGRIAEFQGKDFDDIEFSPDGK